MHTKFPIKKLFFFPILRIIIDHTNKRTIVDNYNKQNEFLL